MIKKDWSIRQLHEALAKDLLACHTQTERLCARAIGGLEIKATAERFARTRRLTATEIEIASQYGYSDRQTAIVPAL